MNPQEALAQSKYSESTDDEIQDEFSSIDESDILIDPCSTGESEGFDDDNVPEESESLMSKDKNYVVTKWTKNDQQKLKVAGTNFLYYRDITLSRYTEKAGKSLVLLRSLPR